MLFDINGVIPFGLVAVGPAIGKINCLVVFFGIKGHLKLKNQQDKKNKDKKRQTWACYVFSS